MKKYERRASSDAKCANSQQTPAQNTSEHTSGTQSAKVAPRNSSSYCTTPFKRLRWNRNALLRIVDVVLLHVEHNSFFSRWTFVRVLFHVSNRILSKWNYCRFLLRCIVVSPAAAVISHLLFAFLVLNYSSSSTIPSFYGSFLLSPILIGWRQKAQLQQSNRTRGRQSI